jgi:hypothetical protein
VEDRSEHTVLPGGAEPVEPCRQRAAITELFEVIQFTLAVSFSRLEVLLLDSAMLKVPSSSLPPPGTSLQERDPDSRRALAFNTRTLNPKTESKSV